MQIGGNLELTHRIYKIVESEKSTKGYFFKFLSESSEPLSDLTGKVYYSSREGKQKNDEKEENLHFTVGLCLSGADRPSKMTDNDRTYEICEYIPFDLDHVSDEGKCPEQVHELVNLVMTAINVSYRNCIVIWSGHGLQLLVKNDTAFPGSLIRELRPQYNALCDKIQEAIVHSDWYGEDDSSNKKIKLDRLVFRNSGTMRLPGTINRKLIKKSAKNSDDLNSQYYLPTEAKLLAAPDCIVPIKLIDTKDLETPETKFTDKQITQNSPTFQTVQIDKVFSESGCRYLWHLWENPEEIEYADCFHGLIGILGTLPDAVERIQQFVAKAIEAGTDHETIRSYQNTTLLKKQIQTYLYNTNNSPTKCSTIADKTGGSLCNRCPHFGKVRTPLSIKTFEYARDNIVTPDDRDPEEGQLVTQWKIEGFSRVIIDPEGKKNPKITRYPARLQRYFAHEFRYVGLDGQEIYIYKEGIYKEVSKKWINAKVQELYEPVCESINQRREAVNQIYSSNYADPDFFEKEDNTFMAFANTAVKIHSNGKLEATPHSPKHRLLNKFKWNFTPDQHCSTYDTWIRIVIPNQEDRELVEAFFGYAIVGQEYRDNIFLLMQGDIAGNGKSTLLNLFTKIIGEENCGASSLASIDSDRFGPIKLHKMLANVSADEPSSVYKDTGWLKRLTGNDRITVRDVAKSAITFCNKAKIIIASNNIPDIKSVSRAIKRRMRIIPFTHSFDLYPETMIKDPVNTMLREAGGIMIKWVKAYYAAQKNWASHGTAFPQTRNSEKLFERYQRDSNPIIEVFEQEVCITGNKDHFISFKDLMNVYLEIDHDPQLTLKKFNKIVRAYLASFHNPVEEGRPHKVNHSRERGLIGVTRRKNGVAVLEGGTGDREAEVKVDF
jgi:P4 family phage/plasmid primase-like protien